ncbi:hypothetical protein BIW11_04897 [Tropilaelaps mercedesae]|uniref:Uncharacterized protein n=1 Tax=Tropilaelaps mercedesae TaxID=418985 RepID=A0A1V9X0F7_9ACAR|nr:hypothetical protein BIW11_04897 [Tropilaelaps mercedesae]
MHYVGYQPTTANRWRDDDIDRTKFVTAETTVNKRRRQHPLARRDTGAIKAVVLGDIPSYCRDRPPRHGSPFRRQTFLPVPPPLVLPGVSYKPHRSVYSSKRVVWALQTSSKASVLSTYPSVWHGHRPRTQRGNSTRCLRRETAVGAPPTPRKLWKTQRDESGVRYQTREDSAAQVNDDIDVKVPPRDVSERLGLSKRRSRTRGVGQWANSASTWTPADRTGQVIKLGKVFLFDWIGRSPFSQDFLALLHSFGERLRRAAGENDAYYRPRPLSKNRLLAYNAMPIDVSNRTNSVRWGRSLAVLALDFCKTAAPAATAVLLSQTLSPYDADMNTQLENTERTTRTIIARGDSRYADYTSYFGGLSCGCKNGTFMPGQPKQRSSVIQILLNSQTDIRPSVTQQGDTSRASDAATRKFSLLALPVVFGDRISTCTNIRENTEDPQGYCIPVFMTVSAISVDKCGLVTVSSATAGRLRQIGLSCRQESQCQKLAR